MLATAALLALATTAAAAPRAWKEVSVEDYGAKGDNLVACAASMSHPGAGGQCCDTAIGAPTDNTKAFRAALAAVKGGGQVLVPAGKCYRTAPFNLSSDVVFKVDGTVRAVEDRDAFPDIDVLPHVGHDYDTNGHTRKHPFVFAVGGSNITITGSGTIDGAGAYWWPRASRQLNHGVGRPHLLELQSVTGVTVTGVTLLNSAFWTFHPVYCKDVHIHHMQIQVPWLAMINGSGLSGFNGDGIDVDSSQNVLVEHNFINCGDDHVTILSGTNGQGPPAKNITVRHNRLGTGMGLSVGSSVAGGVEDVLYAHNWMNESAGQWGMGVHIKTRTSYGGYIRNVVYDSNHFETAGVPGGAIHLESGYQSGGAGASCAKAPKAVCTEIRDIVFRNLTFVHSGGTGNLVCFPTKPCQNITFDNVHVGGDAETGWGCSDIASGSFTDVTPPRDPTKGNCNFTAAAATPNTGV